jgi:hypothetical protein
MPLKAYPEAWARHDAAREAAVRWLKQELITPAQRTAIDAAHPVDYYRPNIFLRIGLFIFTCIGAMAASGSVALVTQFDSPAAVAVVYGIGALAVLEFAIKSFRHYHSGLDNAALYTALLAIIGLILYLYFESDYRTQPEDLFFGQSGSGTLLLLLLLAVLAVATLRYADRLVAACAYFAYLALVVNLLLHLPPGRLLLPFGVMLAAAVAYAFQHKARQRDDFFYYERVLNVVKLLALLTFYLGGNYLIVREGNAALLNLPQSTQIPFAPVFYLFTVGVPLAYVYFGLRRANRMMLLVGLAVVCFSIYTYRHYRSLLPPEIAAVIAGIFLISLAAWALHYLRTPRHGLTAVAEDDEPHFNLESLIVAETAHAPELQAPGFEFGGGSSGGGGANGRF